MAFVVKSKREEEFYAAVEVIKTALKEETVVTRDAYGRDTPVGLFMISGTNHGRGSLLEDSDGYTSGGYIMKSDNFYIHIVDPAEVAQRHRETAQKTYEEMLKKASSANAELERARGELKHWDNVLLNAKKEKP